METDRAASHNPALHAAGFLVVRQTHQGVELLLMKHPDRWDLPKGHSDPGENTRQTALRELFEETGIQAHQIQIDEDFEFRIEYWVKDHRGDGESKLKEVCIGLAWLLDPNTSIAPSEHFGFEWFRWSPDLRVQPQTIDPLLAQLNQHWNAEPVPPRFD